MVKQVRLPDDWQAQIVELANYPEERDNLDRQRQLLEGRLSRLAHLYDSLDLERGEYMKRRAELQALLLMLNVTEEQPILQAGEHLGSLAGLCDKLTKGEQREVLHIILADILLDVGERRLIAVKPRKDLEALLRFDGLLEGDDGCFYISRSGMAG